MTTLYRRHPGAGQRALALWLMAPRFHWGYLTLLLTLYSLLSATILWGLFR